MSGKSVPVLSNSHRGITRSGTPGSQCLLRFVSCGRSSTRVFQEDCCNPYLLWLHGSSKSPSSVLIFRSQSFNFSLSANQWFFFFNNSGKGKTANTYGITYSCLENSMGRGARQATAHGATRVRHSWVSEQTWHLLVVIKPQASPLTAQVPATAPLSGNTHHKHLHAQRISYNSCLSASLYPFPNGKSFQDYPGFQRESPSLQLN